MTKNEIYDIGTEFLISHCFATKMLNLSPEVRAPPPNYFKTSQILTFGPWLGTPTPPPTLACPSALSFEKDSLSF